MTARLVITTMGALAPEIVARAASAAGCGPARTLWDGAMEAQAADLDPARLAAARRAVESASVDVNLVAAAPAPRLLISDMDSTVIAVECIDEIADVAGVGAQVAAVTERAMRGELDFEAALAERVALLAGLDAAALETVWRERVRLNPGAAAMVAAFRATGAHAALVSGGFDYFTERVAAAAGFDSHRANRLEIAFGRLTGRTAGPVLGRDAKRARMEALMAEGGYGAEAVVAVGDGANDLAMVEAAGLGVAYRAKPALAEAADARLDHSDLSAVAALAGIPRAR
jgi:phosphoserine phosphatase